MRVHRVLTSGLCYLRNHCWKKDHLKIWGGNNNNRAIIRDKNKRMSPHSDRVSLERRTKVWVHSSGDKRWSELVFTEVQ